MAEPRTIETSAAERAPWVSPDGATIFVLAGEAAGRSFRLPALPGKVIRVGKADDNDLVLADKTVSRHHLEIGRSEQGILVHDLGSRNGTLVGGVRVGDALLEPGTIVSVGDTRLLVRIDTQGAAVPPSPAGSFHLAIGETLAMRRIFGLLELIAPTDATVLLMGETGTGKDVLARSIHAASRRHALPFEVVDCGAISPSLIESELFGHERGAFTGAVRAHEGAFERAAGGTVFLDELGELPLAVQPKLLRTLDARQIRRVGGRKPIDVDVRIIAATTRDLEEEVTRGTFRQDLYYRLAVVPIHVPPLRERIEDLPLLVERILSGFGEARLTVAPKVIAQLRSYPWPGNVRELRNVLERAAVLAHASGDGVVSNLLLSTPKGDDPVAGLFAFEDGTTYHDARLKVEAAFERRFVAWALGRSGGNVAAAAREAKMDRKYLAELVRKHGL